MINHMVDFIARELWHTRNKFMDAVHGNSLCHLFFESKASTKSNWVELGIGRGYHSRALGWEVPDGEQGGSCLCGHETRKVWPRVVAAQSASSLPNVG